MEVDKTKLTEDAHCKRGDCPKIKKLLKQLKNDNHR